MDKYSILKQYYGHSAFRAGQEALIDAILSGRDALCVMPTGGGKSLCYQIPALLLPGITLVVSPLISLMKDQVAALKSAGAPAAYINSSLTGEQIRTVYARTRKGAYKLIYVAPERLETNSFLSLMQEMDVSFLAVDEAHCISQWGQDFRPSYLGIVDFINTLPRRPIGRGLHRDGDKAGAVRHSAALAAAKPVPHRDGLRPSEPLFRRAPPEKQVFRPRRTH